MFNMQRKEIYKQIKEYGRNTDFLKEFAKFCNKRRIQEVTLEDLRGFYVTHIDPISSTYFRIESVKYINKFLRAYGVPFVMRTEEVIEITPNHDIIESMKTVSPYDPTPKSERNMRLVKLRDEDEWSFSDICAEFGFRSKATAHQIYHREKKRMEDEKKLSTV